MAKAIQRVLLGAARAAAFCVAALLGTIGAVPQAAAGGFEFGDNGTRAVARGGAFTALSDDLTAVMHNPGALVRSSGTRFLYNHNLSWANLSLTREPSVIDSAGFDELINPGKQNAGVFPLGITAVVGSDFGLEDWSFALGVFGPSGIGTMKFPQNGAQRYLMTGLEAAMVYYTASVAYGRRDKWGVGVSLQYVHVPFIRFNLVVDAQPNSYTGINPHTSPFDIEAELDMSDPFAFTAIVGGWWRPIEQLEVGVSARVVPVYLKLDGDVNMKPIGSTVSKSTVITQNTGASMDLTLPAYVRGGVRYRYLEAGSDGPGREIFDIELDATWEGWSSVNEFAMDLRGTAEVPAIFPTTDLPDLSIPRAMRDTFSVRLGGTYSPLEWLGISLGAYWESAAIPQNYEHVDFPSFMRVGVGGGLRFQFSGVDLNVAYLHIFQEDRNVDERFAKIYQVRPIAPCSDLPSSCNGSTTGAPANSGRYQSSFDMLSFGMQFHFDKLFE